MSVTSIDKDPDALTMTVTAHLDATVMVREIGRAHV